MDLNLINHITNTCRSKKSIRPLAMLNAAHTIAVKAHWNQTRKDGVTPQITHPLKVQGLLAQCGVNDINIHCAALLHDALEDNPGLPAQKLLVEMAQVLPIDVIETIAVLTDTPGLPSDVRKALQLEKFANASLDVKLIKLADVVASLQEGPAPNWTNTKKLSYLAQRKTLVREVLGPCNGRLRVLFERAIQLPFWQTEPL